MVQFSQLRRALRKAHRIIILVPIILDIYTVYTILSLITQNQGIPSDSCASSNCDGGYILPTAGLDVHSFAKRSLACDPILG